jgi:hypothetical protein
MEDLTDRVSRLRSSGIRVRCNGEISIECDALVFGFSDQQMVEAVREGVELAALRRDIEKIRSYGNDVDGFVRRMLKVSATGFGAPEMRVVENLSKDERTPTEVRFLAGCIIMHLILTRAALAAPARLQAT